MISRASLLFIMVQLYGMALHSVSAQAARETPVPDDLQTKIVDFYSKSKCDEVRHLVRGMNLHNLRPNIMAIAAYCQPDAVKPEDLFQRAESLSPTGDLIFTLHAMHVYKTNPIAAKPLWEKVLMIARNQYFRDLAKDHLAGVVKSIDEKPLSLSPNTGFIRGFVGAHVDRDARPADYTYQQKKSGAGLQATGIFGWRRWYNFGSIGVNYKLDHVDFLNASQFNRLDNHLEVPIALHVVSAKDIEFRPFFGYSRIGTSSFQSLYGLGVKGVVYKSTYVQSVQGIMYSDHIYNPNLKFQAGSHYRFEYQWDFFPRSWFLSSVLFVEHVSATRSTLLFGRTGDFVLSHNDVGFNSQIQKNFEFATIGFDPRFTYRLDSLDSEYTSTDGSRRIFKSRQDFILNPKVSITVPILPKVQLISWYEWKRVFSNLEDEDYINRNYENHTLGIGLRTSLSTY